MDASSFDSFVERAREKKNYNNYKSEIYVCVHFTNGSIYIAIIIFMNELSKLTYIFIQIYLSLRFVYK